MIQESELRRVSRSARRRALLEQAQWCEERALEAVREYNDAQAREDEPESAYQTGLQHGFRMTAERLKAEARGLE
jgi:sugar (pentulose or hexulose) kinase